MKKLKKINVVKKVGISFLIAPLLATSNAFAEKSSIEQAEYQSCMSTKHQWLFANFNYKQKNSTEAKQSSLLLIEKTLKDLDVLRISSATLLGLINFASTLDVPRNVVESMICIERIKRNHPEDNNNLGNDCAQSCAITVR